MFQGIPAMMVSGAGVVSGGGGGVFIINEDFEGTGTPAGWFQGNAADFDYTGAPLAGSQSLRIAVATSDFAVAPALSPDLSEVWGEFMFKTEVGLPASFHVFLTVEDSAASNNFALVLFSDGKVSADGGSTFAVATMAANTTYYVWWHYKQGASSNATVEMWFSTTNTRPAVGSNNYNGLTNRTENWQVHTLKMSTTNGATNTADVYDNFQVSATDMWA